MIGIVILACLGASASVALLHQRPSAFGKSPGNSGPDGTFFCIVQWGPSDLSHNYYHLRIDGDGQAVVAYAGVEIRRKRLSLREVASLKDTIRIQKFFDPHPDGGDGFTIHVRLDGKESTVYGELPAVWQKVKALMPLPTVEERDRAESSRIERQRDP